VSETTNLNLPQTKRGLGCVTKVALLVLGLVFLFMFMAAGIGSGQVDALVALVFGWMSFLKRTAPDVSWNWDLIGMAVFCSAVIIVLGHRFASWVTTSIAAKRGLDWRWPWKWTCCGLAMVGLSFLVGMSVGGAAHQIGWLAGSQESWFERKPRFMYDRIQMRNLEMELQMILAETNTVAAVRQQLRDSDTEKRSLQQHKRSSLQSFHVLIVSTNREHVDGVIVFPRAEEVKSRLHGFFVNEADQIEISPATLPAFIREREPYLIAF
jgi:hypothetical protein